MTHITEDKEYPSMWDSELGKQHYKMLIEEMSNMPSVYDEDYHMTKKDKIASLIISVFVVLFVPIVALLFYLLTKFL